MAFAQFDRGRLRLQPLADRTHDVDRSCMVYPDSPREPFDHAALPELAERIVEGARAGNTVMFCCGAHVLRKGNGPLLIDLMERGLLTHLALNGAGAIHDFELAMIGSTCESVARYVRSGEFGLWNETGRINDAAVAGARDGIGFGEAVGRMIEEEKFPYRETSVLAAGYRLGVPVTVHVAIGQDIIHEHPNFDPAATGAATYADFLVFTESLTRLEGGVFLNIGTAVMGPEVYLKALTMARNVARQEGKVIQDFTTAVFDLAPLGNQLDSEAAKTDPKYYFRPYKTILVRTVADGGRSHYVEGDHRLTVPALYDQIPRKGPTVKTFGGMSDERLQETLDRFSRSRIAVLGDFFLDKYLDVEPAWAEFSIETGKTANQVAAIRTSPGAAGTVVCNLAALGAGTLHAVGFTGDDGESYDLRKGLAALGCGTNHLHYDRRRMTPTYLKPRDRNDASLAGEHERYDTKNRRPTPPALGEQIVRSLDALLPELDAVIVLDQVEEADCGVVTAALREVVADRARQWPGVVFWGDSRLRIREFRNVIIKPNQFEALGTENPPPGYEVDLDHLAATLARLRQITAAPVVATRGARGIVVTDPEMTFVPGVVVEGPTDPTGAGDSATAGAVLALTAGAELPEAALVANLVASITVQQLATTGTARREQLPQRLEVWRQQNG